MTKIKRIIACLSTVILITSGCTSQTINNGQPDKNEEIVLTMWSIATESDAFHSAYLNAIESFEANNPGVRIRLETFDNETYKTKIRLAVAANELPDIFFTWGGGFSRPFVESGKVLELTSTYEKYREALPEQMLENVTHNGRIYGSVITVPISMLFYNEKMFVEHGLQVPTTWEEWQEVCEAFIALGITPISISAKETWGLAMLHDGLTLKSAGPEKVQQALLTAEQSYDDEVFLASARKLRQFIDMGAFCEYAIQMSNDEAGQDFYNGQTAMFVTGSWVAASIWTDAENPLDFSFAPIPAPTGANVSSTDFMGGPSDTLMASANTKYPDIVATAIFELTREISRYAYLDGAATPPWKIDFDDSQVNPLTKRVAEYVAGATSFTLWFDTLLEAENTEAYLSLLQELYVENITPEEFVAAMDRQLQGNER